MWLPSVLSQFDLLYLYLNIIQASAFPLSMHFFWVLNCSHLSSHFPIFFTVCNVSTLKLILFECVTLSSL